MDTTEIKSDRVLRSNMSGEENEDLSFIDISDVYKIEKKCPRFPPDKRTGLVYDPNCTKHFNIWDSDHEENPKRFTRTLERLKEVNLIEKCVEIKPRPATLSEILLVHDESYVKRVEDICSNLDPEKLEQEASKFDSVYFTPNTFDCALSAAGSAIELVDNIVNKKISNGFALIRPPGHHALVDEACGYCIFNNVAIAAKYCLENYQMKRIIIIDWDVHHGQATQRFFYDDERVLYVSIHRYEEGAFWPQLYESNFNAIGQSKGKGFNINVPLNCTNLSDTDYLAIWHNLLLPVFYEFNPELILVSAGYDAAIGCPQGEMCLSPSIYGHFTHYLMGLAHGKVGVLLEGGYCVESLADGVVCTVKALLGEPLLPLNLKYPINVSVVQSILSAIFYLRPYWDILQMQNAVDMKDGMESGELFSPAIQYKGTVETMPKITKYPTRGECPKQSEEVKENYYHQILKLRNHITNSLSFGPTTNRTCFASLFNMISDRHKAPEPHHAERPSRTRYLCGFLQKENILNKCLIIEAEDIIPVTEEQILRCHSRKALEQIKITQEIKPQDNLRTYEGKFDSIYFTNDTFKVVTTAAGILLQVVDRVLTNVCLNGFASIRPPGHHAGKDSPGGFCYFNNIAIAAFHAIDKYSLNRILILDWDVHHGNGTQEIVMNDERILFISLHRYDDTEFYPNKPSSNYSTTKNIINIPWNGGPMSDKEYLAAFCNIVLPVAYNFDPELVLISAGFDAAKGDPLGKYNLSPAVYGHLTHMMCSLANGKVVMALEGGYHLEMTGQSAKECILALLGYPPKPLNLRDKKLDENSIKTIKNVIDYCSKDWPCLALNFNIAKSAEDYFTYKTID